MILTVTMNASIDKQYIINEFSFGNVNRVDVCKYSAGGKGLNVSRIISLSREHVTATGMVGGFAGEFIEKEIEKQGITSAFMKISGESRSCINIRVASAHGQTELLEPGPIVSADEATSFIQLYESLIANTEVVVISGSLPRGLAPDYYNQLTQTAKSAGKVVLLDVSGEPLRQALKCPPDYLKPNSDEICELFNINPKSFRDIQAAAEKLYSRGVGCAVVSLGKDGVIVASHEGLFRATTPDIKVVNTVGCGDAMTAAFAMGFQKRTPIAETIQQAVAIATASALNENTGEYHMEDLSNILPLIKVKRLSS